MNRLIFVKRNGKEICLNGTKILIYGGGRFTRSECQRLSLDDAEYIIDSNIDKQGKTFQLYLEERQIVGPSILNELDCECCFILISSKYYAEEIAKKIEEEYPSWKERYAYITEVYFKYHSFDEMIYHDRNAMEVACASNILLLLPEYIQKMGKLVRDVLKVQPGEYSLCPIGNKSKVVFRIETNQGKYIGKFPSWDRWVASYSHRRNIIEIKKQAEIDKLTLYEDETGASISHMAEEVEDWNNQKVLETIRDMIHKMHNCKLTVEESADVVKYLRIDDFKKVIPEINIDLFHKIWKECSIFIPVLCHNDLHCRNILLYDTKPSMIDFEELAMGDAVYDTGNLIMDLIFFRKCQLFSGIDEAGGFFLELHTRKELIHFYACVIAQLMRNILLVEERGEDVSWQKQELRKIISKYEAYNNQNCIETETI